PPLLPLASLSAFPSHSSAAHPALHSFPTRRSSDLPHHLFTLISVVLVCRECDPAALRRLRRYASEVNYRAPESGWSSIRLAVVEDRKSTRLNSSHVSISYAVFCLKKKTTHERYR